MDTKFIELIMYMYINSKLENVDKLQSIIKKTANNTNRFIKINKKCMVLQTAILYKDRLSIK